MAQDNKSNPSQTSDDLTPQGDNKTRVSQTPDSDDKSNAAADSKTDKKLSTEKNEVSASDTALAKLEAEIKQTKLNDAENEKSKSKSAHSDKNTKKQNVTSNTSSSVNTKTPDNKPISAVKKQTSWLAIFAFIFSIAASAFVGFFWWQSQLWLKNQEQVAQLKQQNLISTQQSLGQLQAQFNQLELINKQKLNQAENSTKRVNDSIVSLTARIKELGQSQPNYWLAAEAGYLINLAERRLLVEQDVETAIQLLMDANQRLTAMKDPSVFHIRTGISEDVASLYSIKQPDSDSIYLSLSGLLGEIKTIKFAQVYIPQPDRTVVEQQQVSTELNDWYDNLLTSFKRFFGNFITITKRDAEVQPQLPADQKWFVRANLTTQILMAQNAILDKNQTLFLDSLSQTEDWLLQYFDTDDARVISVITTLNAIKQKDVGLTLPTGLNSQPLVSKYLQQQLALKEK